MATTDSGAISPTDSSRTDREIPRPTIRTAADADAAKPAIVTEFRERLLARHPECDTVDAALPIEEQKPSTTVASDRGYCPDCGSVMIIEKPSDNTAQRRPEDHECHHCGAHFDQPVSQTAFGREW